MRSLFSQVGITREGIVPANEDKAPPRPQVDGDTAEAMGCFASPKRFGHYGPITDVHALSYDPEDGLLAVASRGGMIKVFGASGVELVLEEEGSIASEDPPAHLVFPTAQLLVGVTVAGATIAWDLAQGHRFGHVPAPLEPSGSEQRVTAVHCPRKSDSLAAAAAADAPDTFGAQEERYLFLGFESGRIHVVQILPLCRASGYSVEPRDVASGAPSDMLAPSGGGGGGGDYGGKAIGAVTAIASSGNGALALFGHRHGGIVLWDWVRRKRLAVRGLTPDERLGCREAGGDREVTSLAFHPAEEAFAAGFSSGCYSIFSVSPSRDSAPPRWVREVGDDGLCPREGPTIIRTAVSLLRWVSVKGGESRAWGLLVAGGIEIEEGEDPDGVSLLVPSSLAAVNNAVPPLSGGRKSTTKDRLAAALATLETAAFVPFAIGQERLSHVHIATSGGDSSEAQVQTSSTGERACEIENVSVSGSPEDVQAVGEGANVQMKVAATALEEAVHAPEELIVLGLVTWNEEVRGENGRLQFRRASSVQACPIQTSPYVALLQLAPERIGPHLWGFAAVTATAYTPLLSSSTILDFASCLCKGGTPGGGGGPKSTLLRGGSLRWADSVPVQARDEELSTSEMLVVGHSDGWMSFWECCGPASRQDGISISDGRVVMREIPSGATLLGTLPVAELAGHEGVDVAVTALSVWMERDHVAAAERNACWVAVGFEGGEAAVLALSSRIGAVGDASCGGYAAESDRPGGGGKPLAEKPVEISDVHLSDGGIPSDSDGGSRWKKLIRRRNGRDSSADSETVEDDEELDAAIAQARAEARAIEARGELAENDGTETGVSIPATGAEGEDIERIKGREEGTVQDGGDPQKTLQQELSEAMADEGAWGGSPKPPSTRKPAADQPIEKAPQSQHDSSREASLVQLALRLHSHAVRCVMLSYDSGASSLALVVADAGGVVSVTDVSSGSASLLPMRAPQTRPCHPRVAIGPLPLPLCRGGIRAAQRTQRQGEAGALFVLLEGWLNVFDIASRDPVDVVQLPGFEPFRDPESGVRDGVSGIPGRSAGGVSREENEEKSWLSCVDEFGAPLTPYASEPFGSFPTALADNRDGLEQSGWPRQGKEAATEAPHHRARMQTSWVSPTPSRTVLDGYHGHELQALSDAPPPRPLLLVVRGALAVVLEVVERDAGSTSPFSWRAPTSGLNVAAFKGRPSAEIIVRSRVELPPAEGRALPQRVERAGICMVPVEQGDEGKAARRGCLLATDLSGFVTGLLVPSLVPVFRDRLPVNGDGAGVHAGASLSQSSVCNLAGELTLLGTAGDLTRWSLLTDEAYDKLMNSKPRLIKVSTFSRPAMPTERLTTRQPSEGSNTEESGLPAKSRARGMLGRLSLGGSKKSITDVFAVEPSPQTALRRQSTGGSAHSVSSTMGVPARASREGVDTREDIHAQRKDLFGGREVGFGGGNGGEGKTTADRAGDRLSGTHAAVSEARDLAIERGEKLESMVDKSRQLEDSAMAFGDMAKQLRRQQEDESCSVS